MTAPIAPTVKTTTEECPKGYPHTVMPEGYIQWHAYAEKLAVTHTPQECPGCGLWAIWEPKDPSNEPAIPDGQIPPPPITVDRAYKTSHLITWRCTPHATWVRIATPRRDVALRIAEMTWEGHYRDEHRT